MTISSSVVAKVFNYPLRSLHIMLAVRPLIPLPLTDSQVYIWHRENGTLIETLKGHGHALGRETGCVNAVAWNPTNPGMFASAGDDRQVRM